MARKSETTFPFALSRLLVTEAIRELNSHFNDLKDKERHIESRICNLGKKPGFSMAMLMAKGQPDIDQLEDVGNALAQRILPALCGVSPKSTISQQKVMTLSFTGGMPDWFTCLSAPGVALTPEQTLWFRAYAQFIAGVCIGVLAHYGFDAKATVEQVTQSSLVISLICDGLEGTWEFGCRF